jgi:hypothetical protein
MNCICDEFIFPPDPQISPGLTRLHRQVGTFAEFRRALLRGASIRTTGLLENHPLWSLRYLTERDRDGLKKSLQAIGQWRGRHPKDFGMMLIEMWAYVCDVTSFYDDVFAHESYVRTARRRDSMRKLVSPLGYIPRPAVAALAELAAYADAHRAVTLPIGTSFRSGAFAGSPPQIFELDVETTIHPLLNEWAVLPVRRPTFGSVAQSRQTFLCEAGSVSVKAGDLVLLKVGSSRYARTVISVEKQEGVDHVGYSAVTLSAAVSILGGTPVSAVQLLKPAAKSSLWTRTSPAYGPAITSGYGYAFTLASWFLLDSISPVFKVDQDVIVERGANLTAGYIKAVGVTDVTIHAASTSEIKDGSNAVIAKVPIPAITAQTTEITVSPPITGVGVYFSSADDSPQISIHHSFVRAGKVTIEAPTEIDRTDPINVKTPVEMPRDALAPGKFQLEDFNGLGITRPGSLDFGTGHFSVQGDPWPEKLATPVKLLGNIVSTSRGETVRGETLGVGDASIANQSFTLKKSPLTHLPAPSEKTSSGLTSTLKVYVGGVQWTEVPSFYGRHADDEIYIVRQNDKNESVVTFGDGTLGRRLSTGVPVVAYYRFGGGAAMPPSGSITQVAKPVKGLKGVRGPVAAYGGADAEPINSLQKYAPKSALLLGRAVSVADLEAAAASYSGVRAVAAEWRWSHTLQIPAAHVWYLADGDLPALLLNKLRNLTQPDTPIQVERALPTAATLSIQITTDPRRFETDVLTDARTALMDVETGLLPPERLGIGKPLFRSRLFDFLLSVPGVISITGLSLGDWPFSDYGIKPEAGRYFDFTNHLYLNGRNS